ncbi:MAG: hypothetical protein E5Y74_00180 [Mesorhizobium sp.]|nr:MAG: hypothetical protein E5Y74_00180 [Mesorhizobium sp.]
MKDNWILPEDALPESETETVSITVIVTIKDDEESSVARFYPGTKTFRCNGEKIEISAWQYMPEGYKK